MILRQYIPENADIRGLAKEAGIIAFVYFVVAFIGVYLTPYVGTSIFSEWPTIALACAIGLRYHWIGLCGLVVGALAFHLTHLPFTPSFLLALNAALSGFLFRFCFRLFYPRIIIINTVSAVSVFAFVVAPLVCAVHALITVLTLSYYDFVSLDSIQETLLNWWFSDTLITYIATPALLSWFAFQRSKDFEHEKTEGIVIFAGMAVLSWLFIYLKYLNSPSEIVIFILLPFVLWAALRFKNFGAHLAILVASMIAFVSIIIGYDVLGSESYTRTLLSLQISLIPMSLGGLFVSAAFAERRYAEAELNKLANHDPLTNLPNRAYFQDYLARVIAGAHRQKHQVYLLFIDLDRFKKINDSQGHELGDVVLKIIANRLNDILRTDDFVARLGGDEFAVIFTHPPMQNAANNLAKKIIKSVSEPFEIKGNRYSVGASIGISVCPKDSDDPLTLLRQADLAMYQAKSKQTGFEYYSEEMNTIAHEQLLIENGLRQALDNGELLLMYQPKIDLRTQRVVGLEALVRWLSNSGVLTGPDKFIPIAESTGLIVPIGRFVIREACEQWVKWSQSGLNPPPVAVNISPKQFNDPNLLRDIKNILQETKMDPSFLHVEITESATMDDPERTQEILDAMRKLNLHLYIDDFGVGHSNLGQLRRLPIDALKIDKSFVEEMLTINDDAEIVTAIINLAHALKVRVITEGIENKAQLDFLKSLQCDEGQGYLISKPLPYDQIHNLFNHEFAF